MTASSLLDEIAVVIPVGPGDSVDPALLAALGDAVGAIVVVRSPTSAPMPTSADLRAKLTVLESPPSRPRQLNLGAATATARWLWFLHADSDLSHDALPALDHWLRRQRGDRLGWFDLQFSNDGPRMMWLNATLANARSRWLGLPFGDQGLVLGREVFDRLGGFDERCRAGEDHDLVWRARAIGVLADPVGASIRTSARRYQAHGWLATSLRHVGMTVRQAAPHAHRALCHRLVAARCRLQGSRGGISRSGS